MPQSYFIIAISMSAASMKIILPSFYDGYSYHENECGIASIPHHSFPSTARHHKPISTFVPRQNAILAFRHLAA